MKCPCGHDITNVLDSRLVEESTQIRRRRVCKVCGIRFTTYEIVKESPIYVIKKDNRREPFDRNKVLEGIKIACKKRPISMETIEDLARYIEKDCYDGYQKEIRTKEIGKKIMQQLEKTDAVAYVRFASVYKEFKDISFFMKEIKQLKMNPEEKKEKPDEKLLKKIKKKK